MPRFRPCIDYNSLAKSNQGIFKELFTPALNGIAVTVLYVFSLPAVLHARLNDQQQRMQGSEENPRLKFFLKWDIDMKIQLQVVAMHSFTSLLYMSQSQRMNEKHPTKHCKLIIVNIRETSNSFSCHQPVRYVGTCRNLACLGSFAKVSVLVWSILP